MAPQYKNKDDSKKNNNHTDNSWEETIVNGFQLDSALPEDGKSHREENREKASDKKNRYESFCEEWGWDDSI
ncbi:17050_t:CDS:2 [Rhizophagus irregularis]|nr:17050_t:CDS:2 [Rhizophagus irregularis]